MDAATRLALPAAYADPAFVACLMEAVSTPDLLDQFDRLYGARMATGKASHQEMDRFTQFVHDSVYLRLPDEAIHSLRAASPSAIEA